MRKEEKMMMPLIEASVLRVRSALAATYDIGPKGKHRDYAGLCDTACEMVQDELRVHELGCTKSGFNFTSMHGEMRHNPMCLSMHWPMQHTWLKVEWDGNTLYIDPTASQFAWLFDDIPDYYISDEPPKWYYDDRKNPAWNGFWRRVNETIVIPHKYDGRKVTEGIVEFCQYIIWGKISDVMRKIAF